MRAQVAPSGECLQGDGQAHLIGLLQLSTVCIWLLTPRAKLVVAVLNNSTGHRSITAVLRERLLFNLCNVERYVLTEINEDYYYYYY